MDTNQSMSGGKEGYDKVLAKKQIDDINIKVIYFMAKQAFSCCLSHANTRKNSS